MQLNPPSPAGRGRGWGSARDARVGGAGMGRRFGMTRAGGWAGGGACTLAGTLGIRLAPPPQPLPAGEGLSRFSILLAIGICNPLTIAGTTPVQLKTASRSSPALPAASASVLPGASPMPVAGSPSPISTSPPRRPPLTGSTQTTPAPRWPWRWTSPRRSRSRPGSPRSSPPGARSMCWWPMPGSRSSTRSSSSPMPTGSGCWRSTSMARS